MSKQEKPVMTGYYRVSTKAESQNTSFSNQPIIFQTLLETPRFKNYKRSEKFYCDYGISGTKLNRPGFKEMLEDAGLDVEIEDKAEIEHPEFPGKIYKQRIYHVSVNPMKKPKFDEIWIKSTSRLARNINAYQILETLKLAKVYVYFIDRDLCTRNDEDMAAIRKCLDEDMAYSEGLSRNMRLAHQQFRRENRVMGDNYGWVYHKRTKTKLPFYTIHPEESKAVLKMHEYCHQGLGTRRISKALADEGILTRAKKPFSTSEILRILKSEKYKGLNFVGKYTTGPLFQKLSTPIVLDDYKDRLAPTPDLPAIVPPDIWDKTQEILAGRHLKTSKAKGDKTVGQATPRHPLANTLVCGYCGNHFIYDNNNGRGYFKCATKRNKGVQGCNCNNVFNYKLDEYLEILKKSELHSFIESDYENTIISLITFIEAYLKLYINPLSIEELNMQYQEINAQLQSQRALRDNFVEMISGDNFSQETFNVFRVKINSIDEEIKVLEMQLADLLATPTEIEAKLEQLFSVTFNEFSIFQGRKKTYSKEEVIEMLSSIKVYGKTSNNTGGLPPVPILLPVLKTTAQAEGLRKMGYSDFNYRFRNRLPDYEPPESYISTAPAILPELNPVDTDIPACEKEAYYTSAPRDTRKWPTNSSKYNWVNEAFFTPTGDIGFVPDLGVENHQIMHQLKEYTEHLRQEFEKAKLLHISA